MRHGRGGAPRIAVPGLMSLLLSFVVHPAPLPAGADAPLVSLTADDGTWVRTDDYPEQTLVLAFLSRLTDPALLRDLDALRGQIETDKGRFFAIHHGRLDALRAARAEQGLGFQLLYDMLAWSSRAWHQAGRRPYVRDGFAIVRAGKVVHHAIGPFTAADIAAALGTPVAEARVEAATVVDWAKAESRLTDGFVLLDVRTPDEFTAIHHPAARSIPLDELPSRLAELGGAKRVIVVCQTGGRSENAVGFLRSSGVSDAFSVRGGMNAWSGRT